MTFNPDDHLIDITYQPPMSPRPAVLLTDENWDDMQALVAPDGPVMIRPDFTIAEPGDYAVKVDDVRQRDHHVWVVLPASWVLEI